MFPSEHVILLVLCPLVTLSNNSLVLLLFTKTTNWARGYSGGAVDKDVAVIRKMFVHRLHSDMKSSHWSHWCFINTPRDCDFVEMCKQFRRE